MTRTKLRQQLTAETDRLKRAIRKALVRLMCARDCRLYLREKMGQEHSASCPRGILERALAPGRPAK